MLSDSKRCWPLCMCVCTQAVRGPDAVRYPWCWFVTGICGSARTLSEESSFQRGSFVLRNSVDVLLPWFQQSRDARPSDGTTGCGFWNRAFSHPIQWGYAQEGRHQCNIANVWVTSAAMRRGVKILHLCMCSHDGLSASRNDQLCYCIFKYSSGNTCNARDLIGQSEEQQATCAWKLLLQVP